MTRIATLLTALLLFSAPASAQVIDSRHVTAESTGACNAGACATFQLPPGSPSLVLDVSGTFTGTLTFEGTADGITFRTVAATKLADGLAVTTTASTGSFAVVNHGFLKVQARATAWTSGTAVVTATRGFAGSSGAGSGGGTQYADGAASATPTGNVIFGFDGANVRALLTGSGVVGSSVLRFTLATDDTLVTDTAAVRAAVESAAASLDNIETNMSADAVAGNTALTTGPQLMVQLDDTTPATVSEGQARQVRGSSKGDLYTYLRDAAGNERGANVNASNQLLTAEANSTSILAALAASTQHYRTSAGATEDEFEVKATAGVLTGGIVTNTAATVSYLKCSNATAANTTPGTTAVFFGVAIPGATTGAGFSLPIPPGGITFSTALTCYLVKGAADTDVAEVGANEVKVNLFYR